MFHPIRLTVGQNSLIQRGFQDYCLLLCKLGIRIETKMRFYNVQETHHSSDHNIKGLAATALFDLIQQIA